MKKRSLAAIICVMTATSVTSVSAQCPMPTPGTSETAYVTIVHSDGTRTRYALPPNPSTTDRGCVVTYARNKATAGDTIVVGPGEAEVKNLLKNGVNWSLADGVVLESTTANTVGIFDDGPNGANGPVVSSISGRGVIKCTSTSSTASTINVVNSGSNIHVQAKEVSSRSLAVILQKNGTGYFDIDSIDGTNSGSAGVWWFGGETYVQAEVISSGGITVYSSPDVTSPQSNLWVRAKKILSTGNTYAVESAGTEHGSKIWVDAEFVGSSGASVGAVFVSVNKLYVTALKIDNESSGYGIFIGGGGALWITAQKVTGALASATNAEFVSSTGSSISHLDVLQWELLGNQSAAVNVYGGTVFASGRVWQTGTGDGFNCSGGTLYVEHANISTQTGHYDLVQSGSGVLTVTGTVYDATKVSGTIRQGDPHVAIAPGYGTGSTLPADGGTYQFFLNTSDHNIWSWNGSSWVRLNN